MRSLKILLFRLIGVGIFIYLIMVVVNPKELGRAFRSLDVHALLWVIPLHLLQWTLRVLRWQILLRNEGIAISFHENYAVATAGFFLGCLTPGRVGEFAKVKFLMNAGYPFRGAFMSSLLERILDLAALGVFVLLGITYCLPLFQATALAYGPVTLLLCGSIVVLFWVRSHLKALVLRLLPETLAEGVERKMNIFRDSWRAILGTQWLWIGFYSLAIWGLNYWMIHILFQGLGYSLSLLYSFSFAAFGSLAGLLPISVYGMGIRESLLIGLFALLRWPAPDTAGILFGLMFMVLLVYHVLLGFVWWMSPAMKRFVAKN